MKNIILLFFLTSQALYAEYQKINPKDIPSQDNIIQVGKTPVFVNLFGENFYLPVFYTPIVDCEEYNGTFDCLIKITNQIQDSDLGILKPYNAFPITDLSQSFRDINFKLDALDELKKEEALMNHALTMTPDIAFLTIRRTVTKDEYLRFNELYETSGLGEFQSIVDLVSSSTDFHLELSDAKKLNERLLSFQDKTLTLKELNAAITKIIASIGIDFTGFDAKEVNPLVHHLIRTKYFKKTGANQFVLLKNLIDTTKNKEILFDDTLFDRPLRCTTQLLIKKDASSKTTCESSAK